MSFMCRKIGWRKAVSRDWESSVLSGKHGSIAIAAPWTASSWMPAACGRLWTLPTFRMPWKHALWRRMPKWRLTWKRGRQTQPLSGPDVPWQSWVLLRFFAVKSLRGTSLSACLRGEKLNAKFWNPWPLKILQMRGFARQDFGGLSDLFLLQPAIASSFFFWIPAHVAFWLLLTLNPLSL